MLSFFNVEDQNFIFFSFIICSIHVAKTVPIFFECNKGLLIRYLELELIVIVWQLLIIISPLTRTRLDVMVFYVSRIPQGKLGMCISVEIISPKFVILNYSWIGNFSFIQSPDFCTTKINSTQYKKLLRVSEKYKNDSNVWGIKQFRSYLF